MFVDFWSRTNLNFEKSKSAMQTSGVLYERIGAITSFPTLNKHFSPVLAAAAPLVFSRLYQSVSVGNAKERSALIYRK